ncbi:hypothetical protein SCORR_v1c03680 [Spiroplasma corruscae]|uniref:Uncharacterized protein n=1 Tax=Spiroplasma corruscae TaxID=216934 RepID=A0A222ENS0_9MOLU|nr:hypothetical protein [Spiroplasma corruscae]ASP28142.1 hypothetical protein SCORR_v1c03680 [Spiroplasma corruscae]
MLGKYNFTKDQYLIFKPFFEEVLVTLDTLLLLIDKDLKISTVYRKSFDDVLNAFNNITYIDDFNDFKDNYKLFYQDILNTLIVENKKRVVDRHIVLKFIEQSAELIRISDLAAKISYENVLSGNEVLNIDDTIAIIWNEIKKHTSHIEYYNKNYPNIFSEESKEKLLRIFNSRNLYDWENSINDILDELESYALKDENLHDIFIEGTSDYWFIVGILNKISILILLILSLLKKRK